MKRLAPLLLLLVTSCANPYAYFYKGIPDARVFSTYEPVTTQLQIINTDNFDRDFKELLKKGYVKLGQSYFNAGADEISEFQLREHASKIGAHVVLRENEGRKMGK